MNRIITIGRADFGSMGAAANLDTELRRKTRKSRPTRASRGSAAIPAGQAPDGYPSAW